MSKTLPDEELYSFNQQSCEESNEESNEKEKTVKHEDQYEIEKYNKESIFLAYNLERLLDILFLMKENLIYSGLFDLDINSNDFVSLITNHISYYNINDESEDLSEEYEFETS
jgi:hypothetical protein